MDAVPLMVEPNPLIWIVEVIAGNPNPLLLALFNWYVLPGVRQIISATPLAFAILIVCISKLTSPAGILNSHSGEIGVLVGDGVKVAVGDGVSVKVLVGVADGVKVVVGDGVSVKVLVGVADAVGDGVSVKVLVGIEDGVKVVVGDGV